MGEEQIFEGHLEAEKGGRRWKGRARERRR